MSGGPYGHSAVPSVLSVSAEGNVLAGSARGHRTDSRPRSRRALPTPSELAAPPSPGTARAVTRLEQAARAEERARIAALERKVSESWAAARTSSTRLHRVKRQIGWQGGMIAVIFDCMVIPRAICTRKFRDHAPACGHAWGGEVVAGGEGVGMPIPGKGCLVEETGGSGGAYGRSGGLVNLTF